ncbi:hypothetical protein WOLCODRAFT_109466 [Wolfiporia cocos MD-104 SS10]|uniref:Uncharacterized protein n=1 Tax=Wolfiporia cocos (strain MD-104) TaxID=742152 RepID=A0A2H3J3Z0_WOLCO|nr:hypothetical protein WOLCODRAFT_109466 [Wolfiporia cocos MD-104 SS10]
MPQLISSPSWSMASLSAPVTRRRSSMNSVLFSSRLHTEAWPKCTATCYGFLELYISGPDTCGLKRGWSMAAQDRYKSIEYKWASALLSHISP